MPSERIFAKPDSKKNEIELLLQLHKIRFAADFVPKPEVYSQSADQLYFAKAIGGAKFVFRDAVRIQAAGQGFPLENVAENPR